MAAFERAVRMGYRYLETDTRATADGVALAFHDATLDRVTDAAGRVAALPWARVRRARVAGSEPVPRLEDVLGAWPDVRVNVDVKAASAVGPLADAVRRTRSLDRVCLASFSDRRLLAARRALGPRAATSLGPTGVAALRLAAAPGTPPALRRRLLGALRRAVCVQVPVRWGGLPLVDRAVVRAAHEAGLHVHVWVVDDPVQAAGLLDLGVDGLVTDALEVVRDVLRDRGAPWGRPA